MESSPGEARCMCSELVSAHWVDEFGHKRKEVANLEEIWPSGARLQLPTPIRQQTQLRIVGRGTEFLAQVCTCAADFAGYFAEVQFEGGYEWSKQKYLPEHFFDPQTLRAKGRLKQLEERNAEQLANFCKSLSAGAS